MSTTTLPAIQVCRFPNGGFVLHKIHVPESDNRFSAWFDNGGNLRDAEGFTRANRTIAVRPNGPIWQSLARVGRAYVV